MFLKWKWNIMVGRSIEYQEGKNLCYMIRRIKLPVGFPEISESVELLLPLVVGVSKKLSYPKVSNLPKSKQFRLVGI